MVNQRRFIDTYKIREAVDDLALTLDIVYLGKTSTDVIRRQRSF
ncbi:MAG: hypothetical protein U5L96_15990 [Owenweeksia sp.]|nr:hypothetical protein [Owenweeksia sp.]